MFVGHGMIAFVIVALTGRRADWSRDRTLALGALAFAFATLPDVDIVYAVTGLLTHLGGPLTAASAFWATSTLAHRTVTHSLLVGTVAALAFACWHAARTARQPTRRLVGTAAAFGALAALVGVALVTTGPLAAAILSIFACVGLAMTTLAGRRLPWLRARAVAGTALIGLLTHPFGDLFTGDPPAMLYPFDASLVAHRVVLSADPTLHLLAAFGIELLTIWLAVAAFAGLTDRRLRSHVSPRAALGLGYAGAALAIPAPTLSVSYPFVFSILAVGTVGPVELRRWPFGRRLVGDGGTARSVRDRASPLGIADATTALVTALSAVTLAALGYTMAYLLL